MTLTRLQNDVTMAASKRIFEMVGHLLREEDQREFFGMVKEQIAAALITHDVLLERERKRIYLSKETAHEQTVSPE
jgi:hypothetical protein